MLLRQFIVRYKSLYYFGSVKTFSILDGSQEEVKSGPQRSVFQEGMGPTNYGEAYRPRGRTDAEWTHMDRVQEQKNLEEAEDLDVNAAIHGNWTVENAKSKLHQFMQANKINADYKYTQVGPDHSRLVLMKLRASNIFMFG